MKENLILKAYRDKERQSTINIDLKAHTYGFEIYRICLMLLDKLIHLNQEIDISNDIIDNFFDRMKEDYKKYYIK